MARGKDAIDRELHCVWPVVQDGGYIPHLDHMLPHAPFEDYCYYMERQEGDAGKEVTRISCEMLRVHSSSLVVRASARIPGGHGLKAALQTGINAERWKMHPTAERWDEESFPHGESLPMDTKRLQSLLNDPPTEFRPQPVWSLQQPPDAAAAHGDAPKLQGTGDGRRVRAAALGPDHGLPVRRMVRDVGGHALRECKRLGMECQILRRVPLPGGQCGRPHDGGGPAHGGAVPGGRPVHQPDAPRRRGGGVRRWTAILRNPHPVAPEAIRAASCNHPILALGWADVPRQPGAGGFPLPDLTRHDATATFLAVGYEPYARRFRREFGKSIRYAFSDESHLPRSPRGFLWSELLGRDFQKDHGYRLRTRSRPSASA